jgi:hypothetical protein
MTALAVYGLPASGADRGLSPQHAAVRAAVAAFVRAYGIKLGLHLAAQEIGIGERAARHAHEGTYFAADDERARRADLARLRLLEKQLSALRAERDEIKRATHAAEVGARGALGSGDRRAAGRLAASARRVTP